MESFFRMSLSLQFKPDQIQELASRYDYRVSESDLLNLKKTIFSRGYLTKQELKTVAYWKAPRSSANAAKNPEGYVEEVSGFALETPSERARIESLTILDGVRWPTASVILHFFHRDPYPIMDFRTLWSVSLDVPAKYTFGFWWAYVDFCRGVAERSGVDMRTLDKALWQYSKENQ